MVSAKVEPRSADQGVEIVTFEKMVATRHSEPHQGVVPIFEARYYSPWTLKCKMEYEGTRDLGWMLHPSGIWDGKNKVINQEKYKWMGSVSK